MSVRRGAVLTLLLLAALFLWLVLDRRPRPPGPAARAASGWVLPRPAGSPALRPGQPPTFVIAGTRAMPLEVQVVDVTGGPIPGARVRLEEGARELGLTGSSGELAVDLVAERLPQAGRLEVSAGGYGARGAWYRAGTPVLVKLFPENRVAGQVVDGHRGAGVAGLTVLCGRRRTQADGEGRFLCADLAPGPVDIEAFGHGYQGALARPLALSLATVIAGVKVPVSRSAFTVRGRVLSDGTPLAGAEVETAGRGSTSDEAGRYALADLPAGSYDLTVRTGFLSVPQPAPLLVSDHDLEADLEIGARTSLVVEVVDGTGKGVAGQEVALAQLFEDSSIESTERTDGAGQVRFDGLLPGSARLSGPLLPTETIDLARARTRPVRLVLADHGGLLGRVNAPPGTPVGDRSVCATRAGARTDCVDSGADGTWTFGPVAPGRYTVEVRGRGAWSTAIRSHARADAVVQVNTVTEVVLEVVADDGVLAGRVIDAQGAPVEDALVIHLLKGIRSYAAGGYALGGGIDGVVTDAAGRFRITGVRPNQPYEIEAYTRSGRRARVDAAGAEIVVRLP